MAPLPLPAPRFPRMSLPALSRLLTLLLGLCHLGGVCELDAKECQRNYGKESRDYVLAAKSADLHAPAPPPAAPAWRTMRTVVRAAAWVARQTPAVPAARRPDPDATGVWPCSESRLPGPVMGQVCPLPCPTA